MAQIPEYPPILQGTTENKISQLREYLARLAKRQEDEALTSASSTTVATTDFCTTEESKAVTVEASASLTSSLELSMSGYEPVGVTGMRHTSNGLTLLSNYIAGNALVFTVKNTTEASVADTFYFNVFWKST